MRLTDLHAPEWMDRGLCNEIGIELFFPDDDTPTRELYKQAKSICGQCSEVQICLETFLEEPYGVFGKTTPSERKTLIRERKKEAKRLEIKKSKIQSKGKKSGKPKIIRSKKSRHIAYFF